MRDIVGFGDLLLGDFERVDVAPIPKISSPLEFLLLPLGSFSQLGRLTELLVEGSFGSFPLTFVVVGLGDDSFSSFIGVLSRFLRIVGVVAGVKVFLKC